jgi:hypothetical protein
MVALTTSIGGTPRRAATAAVALVALVACPGSASAEPAQPGPRPPVYTEDWGWHLAVEALTDLPLDVGGRASLEMPYGLRATASLGGLPGGYVDLVNAVIVAAGGYDQATADVIASAIASSLVFRVHLGWRPIRRHGFYFEVGYGLVALGGDLTTEDLFVAATGVERPANPRAEARGYDVGSALHMIDVEVGWELVFWRHFVVRLAVGVAATVGATTEVSPRFTPHPLAADGVAALAAEGAAYLDETYTTYVHLPTVSVALGYRFF